VVEDLELARAVRRLVVVLQANLLVDVGGQLDAVSLAFARGYWRDPVLDPSIDVQHPDYQQQEGQKTGEEQ
jgi:hypothetical protein